MIPWFEDFKVGDDYSNVPSVTLTEGFTAVHQAIFGDRFLLSLDYELSRKVTGQATAPVNPSLVCNLAIGQSTIPSQRVMGNLFYRGLVLQRPVFVGDTLTTSTRVVGLRQNKPKPNRAASGMVALEIHTTNQRGETVLKFWRCPMIPCKDPNADTGHQDSFDMMPEVISDQQLQAAIPEWQYQNLPRAELPEVGEATKLEFRDSVTLAPELVRLTQNLAMTHTDASRSVYGKRLVYGGHTISMAAAQLSRGIPNLISILGWYHCNHVAPVFEEDILETTFEIEDCRPIKGANMIKLKVAVDALREGESMNVLDWSLAALAS